MIDAVTIRAEPLTAYAAALLVGAGVAPDQARTAAEVLVWADLRGQAPHGVTRVLNAVNSIRRGAIDPQARIEVEVLRQGVARVNARRGLGPTALTLAAHTTVERAQAAGTAWVFVQDHSHAGALGYYARRVAEAGMLAIATTASRPMMAYFGTRTPTLATSPLAIAVPGGGLLDMSTAAISMGRIDALKDAGEPLPPGVALDGAGQPTTDAAAATTALPLGGTKGSGLALMIEALTSVALANPLIASALRDASQMEDYRLNSVIIALDLAVLGGADAFKAEFDALATAIKAQPKAAGVETIFMPGERGDAESARRLRNGIPVDRITWTRLAELARGYGVSVPGVAA